MPLVHPNNHCRPDLWDARMGGSLLHNMGLRYGFGYPGEWAPCMGRAASNSTAHHMTLRHGVPDIYFV
jgi:hypothetical protein